MLKVKPAAKKAVQKAKPIAKKAVKKAAIVAKPIAKKAINKAKPVAKKAIKAVKPVAKKAVQKAKPAAKQVSKKASAPVKAKPAAKKAAGKASGKKTEAPKSDSTVQSQMHFDQDTGQADQHKHVVIHGPDMHFIPGQGQNDQVRWKDKAQTEKAYEHDEQTALHQEQERVKQNLATRQKRVFNTPR